MQNKANLPKTNVTIVLVRDYENEHNWTLGEIKPKPARQTLNERLLTWGAGEKT
jgi:hypothetical protein